MEARAITEAGAATQAAGSAATRRSGAPRAYLDHAATTPLLPAARAAMTAALERWANPSSQHREGRAARAALEEARARIAAALGWRHALIFTGGATEAAAIALRRTAAPRAAIVAAVEHPAVARARPDAHPLAVETGGQVDPEALARALARRPGAIVAIQHVNSETGVIQPTDALHAVARGAAAPLFCDCAQGAGKLPLPSADLLAVSAHKLGGPPGIGALLVRDLALLKPWGPGQEQGYRPGTENLPAILGFAAAVEAGARWLGAVRAWRAALDGAVRAGGGAVVCDASPRLPTIAAYRLPGMRAAAQLMRLDAEGFAVSAGTACSSGALGPSPVLRALGMPEEAAGEVIRVSFGRTTTEGEVDRFAAAWAAMAAGVAAR